MRDERISKLKEFLKSSPDDEFLNFALAQEYIGMEDDDSASELLKKLRRISPDYVATYYHLGKLLIRQGQNDEAEKIFNEGIEVGRKIKDNHSVSELQSALNELLYDDF
jgi:predicted Zn-dependent protease